MRHVRAMHHTVNYTCNCPRSVSPSLLYTPACAHAHPSLPVSLCTNVLSHAVLCVRARTQTVQCPVRAYHAAIQTKRHL